jgi:hypothetical protein
VSPPLGFEPGFPAHYQLVELDRIDRSGGTKAYAYPGARPVDRQQELAVAPILEVRPAGSNPWVAVFADLEAHVSFEAVIALPDPSTFCVIRHGAGVTVRADDPRITREIEALPITGCLVVPDLELVVFADFTSLVAYGVQGPVWRSRRIAMDDLKIVRAEGRILHVTGSFGDKQDVPFTVDLRTGDAQGQPWQPSE